jgi:hypothetical protein
MEMPSPFGAAAAFAAFVRQRLAEVGDTFAPFTPRWARPDDVQDAARQVALVIVGAAAPFAPTSYARARLLRQLHASGLLSAHESERAVSLLEIAQ